MMATLPPGVFGRAARDAILYADYTLLERMLPGVEFSVRPLETDRWELAGKCADGSFVIWTVAHIWTVGG
jgi:hypothetical protein